MSLSIIGGGEVGGVFMAAAQAAPEPVRIIRRGEDPRAVLPDGPVLVAVREGDLGKLIGPLAPIAPRLVLVQNGWIEPLIAPLDGCTRGLLWFTKKGSFHKVLRPSPFFGPEAAAIVRILGPSVARIETFPARFNQELAYKLAWNNVVGLPLAVHGLALSDYLERQREEAKAVVEESCRVLAAELGTPIDAEEAFALLLSTTSELGWMTGGRKALELRNGAVQRLGKQHGLPTPVNDRLLSS